ncbi:hypothetical protein ACET3Z_014417 [Daucus carota]
MCEPDSDVARWGLDLLDIDQLFSSSYYTDTSQHDVEINHENYSIDSQQDAESSSLHIEETYPHTLQEQLSQLALDKGTESYSAEGDPWPVSTGIQDWSSTYYDDFIRPSSSCSSPEDQSYDGEEFVHTLDITDEFELDGEVGKRLNQMISAPHVPRTNGDIPSVDEATSDHQRLLDRLQLYNLVECKVQGDGNCQFRALSDQLYRTPEHHKSVRRQVVNQLKSHPEMYEGYVPMDYGDYLKKMSKSGEWGDHVTLQAAADSYGVKIFVLTSFKDTCSIEILPKVQKSERVIFLSFWAEVHYNSIYPRGELPPCDYKRKKRWWIFGNKN